MDLATVGGLAVALVAIIVGILVGGGVSGMLALIDPVSAFVVLLGGLGAVIISFPLAKIIAMPKVLLQAVFGTQPDPLLIIQDMVGYAELARREGILSLENVVGEMRDPFIVRGVKMAIDGTDPELIKAVMDSELEALMDRHTDGKKMFDAFAKYAPAYGMIGTLLGLIFMLQNMDDPAAIGPGMAVALITTLYGALVANIFASPVADKLAAKDSEEVLVKSIIISGVMAIQSGDNPRVVESKLATFLPPSRRDELAAGQAA
ncbi:MAG: MotA/TolQ/ExbB proton channel family protein [Planctomycetota bacterium]